MELYLQEGFVLTRVKKLFGITLSKQISLFEMTFDNGHNITVSNIYIISLLIRPFVHISYP